MPTHLSSKPPSYLTVGGLVFTELTKPYIEGALGEHYTPQTMQDVRMLSFTQESIQYEGELYTRMLRGVVFAKIGKKTEELRIQGERSDD